MTLLGGRPNGRGAAAVSVALPGVWVEVDVNGGPKSSGGVVTDGAADQRAALELAFTKAQALRIAQQVIALCDVRDDPEGERWQAYGWLEQFVGQLGQVVPGELLVPGEQRWRALVAVADFHIEGREPAPRTCAVRDGEGRLWLPADALMRHVRYCEGERIGWGELHTRLVDCGWERREVDQWQPGAGRRGRHLRRTFYVEPGRGRDHA